MCYRFAYGDVDRVSKKYKIQLSDDALTRLGDPLNVFPQNFAPVIYTRQGQIGFEADAMRWGLIPFWADDEKIGRKHFNARIETAQEKPSFRSSFKDKRCIVPVYGFYETWREGDKKKYFMFREPEGEMFSMAGLYSEWKNLRTFTVLTMPAVGSEVQLVHDRMPVLLTPEEEKIWLEKGNSPEVISKLINFSKSFKLQTDEKS